MKKIIKIQKLKNLFQDIVKFNNKKINQKLRIGKNLWINKSKIMIEWIKLCNSVNIALNLCLKNTNKSKNK